MTETLSNVFYASAVRLDHDRVPVEALAYTVRQNTIYWNEGPTDRNRDRVDALDQAGHQTLRDAGLTTLPEEWLRDSLVRWMQHAHDILGEETFYGLQSARLIVIPCSPSPTAWTTLRARMKELEERLRQLGHTP